MGKRVVIVLLSLALSAYASPVGGMTSAEAKGTEVASSGKAVGLSASEISHYQQMQSMAEAKGVLCLRGGGPVTDEEALMIAIVAIVATVGIAIAVASR